MASESDNDGAHDEVKRTTIRTFASHESADLAAANLEAHGIECWVNADDCGGWYTNLTAPGGVRLLVRITDTEAAIALLNAPVSSKEINQVEIEAAASAPSETVPLKKLAMGQIGFGILSGIVVGILLCLLYQWIDNLGTKTYFHHVHAKVDKEWIYRNGYLAEFSEDRNLDGKFDHWDYYDEGGKINRQEYDNNFDGKADEFWTFSDDGTDTVQNDTDFNAIPDVFSIYKHEIIQQVDFRPNGSKFTTTREIFQNGVLTEIWRGGDSDGHFKEMVRYDPFFNPISTNIPAAFKLLTPISN
jgi:hypothetical protein